MKVKRVYRKTARTAQERASDEAIRQQFRHQPTQEELLASGEYVGPIPQGLVLEILPLLAELRQQREAAGLSLTDLAARTGIDKATLSKLETGKQPNPTLATLWRYAAALGKRLNVSLGDCQGATVGGKPPRMRQSRATRRGAYSAKA